MNTVIHSSQVRPGDKWSTWDAHVWIREVGGDGHVTVTDDGVFERQEPRRMHIHQLRKLLYAPPRTGDLYVQTYGDMKSQLLVAVHVLNENVLPFDLNFVTLARESPLVVMTLQFGCFSDYGIVPNGERRCADGREMKGVIGAVKTLGNMNLSGSA